MKFFDIKTAERFRDQAFETASKSLMIVIFEGYALVTSRRKAAEFEKAGHVVY